MSEVTWTQITHSGMHSETDSFGVASRLKGWESPK